MRLDIPVDGRGEERRGEGRSTESYARKCVNYFMEMMGGRKEKNRRECRIN